MLTRSLFDWRIRIHPLKKWAGRQFCNMHCAFESLPAQAISTKNKHLLLSFDTNPRFHGGCFGVWGTPPPKPLNCKIRFALPGDAIDRSWAHHVGDDSMLVLAKFSLAPEDITWMSCYSCSQSANLSLTAIHPVSSTGKTKNPAYVSVSRVREIVFVLRYLLTASLSKIPPGRCPTGAMDSARLNAQPGLYRL